MSSSSPSSSATTVAPTPDSKRNHLERIQRISRIMVRICLALIVLMPLVLVFYWATASAPDLAQQGNLQAAVMRAPLQVWQRIAAAFVSAVPLLRLLRRSPFMPRTQHRAFAGR